MNFSNHKAIGRYVYGGKFYIGDCPHCQEEFYLTKEKAQQFVENSWFEPKERNFLSGFIFKITTFLF